MTSISKPSPPSSVLSLSDLAELQPSGGRLAVLGDPIRHSLSPVMHTAALLAMAADFTDLASWTYRAVHVPEGSLGAVLPMLHQLGFVGINLTIPHKVAAFSELSELSDFARRSGAVNTLIAGPDGFRGDNTDGYGIIQAIEQDLALPLSGADVWLFGAGGAARAIVTACADGGARRITIVNRSASRLSELRDQSASMNISSDCGIRFATTAEVDWSEADASLAINATSLGLSPSDPSPINDRHLPRFRAVFDTTYGALNRLQAACDSAGVTYTNGLSMLVWQGVRSLEIWTGLPVPVEVMAAAARAALCERLSRG